MIYLDNAATTKPNKEVIDAMMPYFTDMWQNPSALYSDANKVKKHIESARYVIGDFIHANGKEIYFTSGGSESNCWAIQGFVNRCHRKGKPPAIITSVIEHKSVLDCVDNVNADVHYVPVDNEGFVDTNVLETLLRHVSHGDKEILVSIQFANNEIGTIQNIQDIARLVHRYNAIFHTDAVQAFGKIPIDVKELGIDMLSASGHKIGAPKGVGFLYVKDSIEIDPLIHGSQMDGMRGGTENVPYIIGMAKAVDIIRNFDVEKYSYVHMLSARVMEGLHGIGCNFNGSLFNKLPHVISVTLPQNVTGESLIYMLDMSNIYISAGSACNSHSVEPSHVLRAIGLTDEQAARTVRISLSNDTTIDELEMFFNEIQKQIKLLIMEEW